jgi:hypothetical protein
MKTKKIVIFTIVSSFLFFGVTISSAGVYDQRTSHVITTLPELLRYLFTERIYRNNICVSNLIHIESRIDAGVNKSFILNATSKIHNTSVWFIEGTCLLLITIGGNNPIPLFIQRTIYQIKLKLRELFGLNETSL